MFIQICNLDVLSRGKRLQRYSESQFSFSFVIV